MVVLFGYDVMYLLAACMHASTFILYQDCVASCVC